MESVSGLIDTGRVETVTRTIRDLRGREGLDFKLGVQVQHRESALRASAWVPRV